ncbi:FecCD family ABC transporter permease [Staphylococcus canis]|uniref:Iron ABC transporter permease n=1 Tax=Staphylococcus canis TaxID=2724942 RepID=A0ABS0T8Q8_9STAP|nr:iron ABC transporter permease [Staphylococcus canis]MBI5975115.1 iron ABC transporter permease [Staphylococcus canis]
MRNNRKKDFITISLWSLLLVICIAYSLFSNIDWSTPLVRTLIIGVRMPRVLLALLVGMGLTLAGQMFQIILNNSMADSFTLGLASGATVGAALATFLGLSFIWIPPFAMFIGLVTLFLVIGITKLIARNAFSKSLILSGIMIGALLNAILYLIIQSQPRRLQSILNYMFGGVSSAEYTEVWVIAITLILVVSALFLLASKIKLLQLDTYSSASLGLNVEKLSIIVLILSTLLATVITGFTGVIGFIGIVIPQFVQRIMQSTLIYKMLLNMVIGGAVMVLSDTIGAQILAPKQIPASIILALIGIPLMFYLMIVEHRKTID